MLISQKTLEFLNQQIAMEFQASLQYDAIAAHFEAESLPQLARLFADQSTEERSHAHRLMRYVLDVGGRIAIPALEAPLCHFNFAKDAVRLSLEQEMKVTRSINEIADAAMHEKDHLTWNVLQWFLNEQVEEVSSMDHLLKMVERTGEGGLLMVEQYLMDSKNVRPQRVAFGPAQGSSEE